MADRASLSGVMLPTDPTDLGEAVRAGYMVDSGGRLLAARTPLVVSGVRAGSVSASLTSDASSGGNLINLTVTGNATFGLSNPVDHQVIAVHFLASAGDRTITFSTASIVAAGGRAMSYLVPAGEVLVAEFRYIGTRGTPRWALTRAEVTGASAGAVQADSTTGVNTTSTTYVALSGAPSLVFVAPPSGAVRVEVSSSVAPNVATSAYYAPEVRTGPTVGSGTVVLAAADLNAVGVSTTANGQAVDAGRSTLLTGLTPGAQYNVRGLHRTRAGTGYFGRQRVLVSPEGLV